MFTYLYKLVDKTPVQCSSTGEWAQWFENARRIVKYNRVMLDGNFIDVSTVFLGIDYAVLSNSNKPLLFETQIFGGEWNGRVLRCSTWEQAEMQHENALQLLFSVSTHY